MRIDILRYFHIDADTLSGGELVELAIRLPEHFEYRTEPSEDGQHEVLVPLSSIARYYRDNPRIHGTTEDELVSDEELAALMA